MRRFMLLVITAALALGVLGACGGGDDDNDTAASAGKSTTTTENDSDATTTTAKATTTTAAGPGVTVKAAGDVEPGGYGWRSTAAQYEGLVGKQLEFGCPPAGQPGGAYGTGLYTDDTNVCTAAVHAGKLTAAQGGQVIITMQPGQPSYKGSVANGVTSSDYGQWGGSYEVNEVKAFRGTSEPQTGGYGWRAHAQDYRGLNGQKFTYSCPPAGQLGSIYGTGTYTDDSPVCTAAVHAGKFGLAQGGTVVIEIKAGAQSYEGSTANGVTSNDYPAYQGSYSIS